MAETKPDLSEKRQHNEAVAYGKLLALREVLDVLHKEKSLQLFETGQYRSGYQRAIEDVKRMRLGVEKP